MTTEQRLLDDLNETQRVAVLHGEGPLLILAGAGSGKTRVITRRIAHLILTGQVDPMGICAITFTNKAAREMKERVVEFVPRADLWVSTFHAMAARILRREAGAIGYGSDFTIYDTYDRGQCLKRVVQELGLDDEVYKPGPLGHRISARKNRGLTPGEADSETGRVDPVLARIEKAYAEKLVQCQALDFDDLLLKLLEVLEGKPEIGAKYAERFRYVLVDEYQDTNALQYRITACLAGRHRNLCVCGDPDQSIYGWRGADLRNILDFEKQFAPVTVVRLETNYRSKRNILDAAQAVIERNVERKSKRLLTESDGGEKLTSILAESEDDEARSIASWVKRLTGAGGARYRDVAVFYRANFLQRALEAGMREAGVPYRVAAGLAFYERREIKDLVAYLRVLVNPRDNVAFERIVNVPSRGIGETTVEKLKAEADRLGVPILAAARERDVRAALGGRARVKLEQFLSTLDTLAPCVDGAAADALKRIILATDYETYCGGLGDGLDEDRVANVRELVVAAKKFDEREGTGVKEFLAAVSLVSDTDQLDEKADAVTLMTLHSSKGLEFPVVFIAGLEEGLLPHRRSIEERAGDEGLEEERRLFYVGLTRARERLFLARARYRAQFGSSVGVYSGETVASRFLREIPARLVDGPIDSEASWGGVAWGGDRWGGSARRRGTGDASFGAPRDDDHSQVAPELDTVKPKRSAPRLQEGQMVRHNLFGVGRVLELRGAGVDQRAIVAFRDGGQKQLLVHYAKLETLSS